MKLFYAASLAFVLCAGAAFPGTAIAQQSPSVDPRIVTKAREWFQRFRTGDIDRSQLTQTLERQLTPAFVAQKRLLVRSYGHPLSFAYMGSGTAGGFPSYDFLVSFPAGKLVESIAFDASGKLAGIDFRND